MVDKKLFDLIDLPPKVLMREAISFSLGSLLKYGNEIQKSDATILLLYWYKLSRGLTYASEGNFD